MVAVNNRENSVKPLPFTVKNKKGKSQTGKKYDPKDSVGNNQPITGLPYMVSNECVAKTMPLPKGPHGDKDSEGLKPPIDMVPQTNKPEPSPAQETQESDFDSSSLDLKKYDNILPLTEIQLVKYLRKVSQVLFNRLTEGQWEKHKESTVSYADLKASIEGYYELLCKNSIERVYLLKSLNGVTEILKYVQEAVKEDLALKKKVLAATKANTINSNNITKLISVAKTFDFCSLKSLVETAEIRSEISSLKSNTSEIKSMMTEIYQAFKVLEKKEEAHGLEPKIKVNGLECNRSLSEGVPFVNNMVIEEPEYGIFFTDVFGDQAFQRCNDIYKVGVDSLVSYLVMASMIKTLENARFCLKLKKLIAEHPDQEKLQSKKVNWKPLGTS
nr:hypothetical protein [Tanacetum cinerariifolium]